MREVHDVEANKENMSPVAELDMSKNAILFMENFRNSKKPKRGTDDHRLNSYGK